MGYGFKEIAIFSVVNDYNSARIAKTAGQNTDQAATK
jgi:hypothetical protein